MAMALAKCFSVTGRKVSVFLEKKKRRINPGGFFYGVNYGGLGRTAS